MSTNVREGDVARVIDGPFRGVVLTVGDQCGVATFLNDGLVCWHTSHSCSHALPDKWLRRFDKPGDHEPTQETRERPKDAKLTEFDAELHGLRRILKESA
jgi:hypothetical protein